MILRSAYRSLRRRPAFALLVIGAVAVGLGAAMAVFQVFYGALLAPLPYPDAERIVVLRSVHPTQEADGRVSQPDLADFEELSRTLERLAAVSEESYVWTGRGAAERLPAAAVDYDYFGIFGVTPILGGIARSEWERPGARVALLSHDLWQNRFGEAVDVVGRVLTLDGEPYTIRGVLPDTADYPPDVAVVTPLDPTAGREARGGRYLRTVATLAPDIDLGSARREVEHLAGQLAASYPETNEGWSATLVPLRQELVGDVRGELVMLLVAVSFVLLLVCANVTGLLVARGTGRTVEIQVRSALGATRGRIARQLWVENTLLVLSGGLLGLLLANLATSFLVSLYPEEIPGVAASGMGWAAGWFGLATALAVAGLVTLPVVWLATRQARGIATTGKGSGATASSRFAARTQAAILTCEIAVTLALLVGAGLVVQSFSNLLSVDPGFEADHLLTAHLSLSPTRYAEDLQRVAFLEELSTRLNAAPGIESVAATTNLPLSGTNMLFGAQVEPAPRDDDEPVQAGYRAVTPGYFETLGIAVLEGREIETRDGPKAPPVVVVNRTFARRFLPRGYENHQLRITFGEGEARRIVGVVADVRHSALRDEPQPEMYVPLAQHPWPFVNLAIRTQGEPLGVAPILRAEVFDIDPEQPVDRIESLSTTLSSSIARPRFYSSILTAFALLALLSASLGIYGLALYGVTTRRHEIGVRMALGASPQVIRRSFFRKPLTPVLAGLLLGGALAFFLARTLAGLLFRVSPVQPTTFVVMTSILLGIAAVAAFVPASRAARMDPAVVLRDE